MSERLVTIIVPVYNVEKYLDHCIGSLVRQTYKNTEIILVDDGSADGSGQMCDAWAIRDSRIRVIHKENRGLGMARNSGLEAASGEYVCFVDSDDYISRETIEECMAVIDDFPYDIVHYGYINVDQKCRELRINDPTPERKAYPDRKSIEQLLPRLIIDLPSEKTLNVNLSACMCLIKTSIIRKNAWSFVSERRIISEDVYSLLVLYRYINSCYIFDRSFYYYRQNPASLTHSFRKDRFEKVKTLYYELLALYSKKDTAAVERIEYFFVSYTIAVLKKIVASQTGLRYKHRAICDIMRDRDFLECIHNIWKVENTHRRIFLKAVQLKLFPVVYALCAVQNLRAVQ